MNTLTRVTFSGDYRTLCLLRRDLVAAGESCGPVEHGRTHAWMRAAIADNWAASEAAARHGVSKMDHGAVAPDAKTGMVAGWQ